MFVEDHAVFFQDFGVTVTIGATSIQGNVDKLGRNALQGQGVSGVSGVQITVEVWTADLPTIAAKGSLTVNGISMKLRERNPFDDGNLTHLLCETV